MLHSSRSNTLVHWTGKDLDELIRSGELSADQARTAYVERLISTLETGLWMTVREETAAGYDFWMTNYNPSVCLSETVLSRSGEHIARYGRLGFGFSRTFILNAGGTPVIYVRNGAPPSLLAVFKALSVRIGNLSYHVRATADELAVMLDFSDLKLLFDRLTSIIKNMSATSQDDCEYLDEAEWRVVAHEIGGNAPPIAPATILHFTGERTAPSLPENWQDSESIVSSGRESPPCFLHFAPDDLSTLILPDDETRRAAWSDVRLRTWIDKRTKPLQILTCSECARF